DLPLDPGFQLVHEPARAIRITSLAGEAFACELGPDQQTGAKLCEMPLGLASRSIVGEDDLPGPPTENALDRSEPRLEVELRWWSDRQDDRQGRAVNAGGVTHERHAGCSVKKAHVMGGVPGHVRHLDYAVTQRKPLAAPQDGHLCRAHRGHFAPQLVHPVAI